MVNAYEIFGIVEDATDDDIKSAYHRLVQRHHPDKGGTVENFLNVQKAYEILQDPEKRIHLAGVRFFRRSSMRIQPSLSRGTSQLFENLKILGDRVNAGV